ncbi:MAG: helix-turn-helix domain-containing protein [Paracoccaceae bacterium]
MGLQKQLAAEYRAGASLADLRRRYGVGKAVLSSKLRAEGLVTRPAHRPVEIFIEEDDLRECVEEGLSQKNMAAIFGCSRSTIHDRLAKLGLAPTCGRYKSRSEVILPDGTTVFCTPREDALLTILARHLGGIVPQETLQHGVFGQRWFALNAPQNMTAQLVTRLRRILVGPAPQYKITTAHGVGYCLEGPGGSVCPTCGRPMRKQ